MDPELSIQEACARTGLSPRTVRYYEELGLLPGVRRRASRHRVYGLDQHLGGLDARIAELASLHDDMSKYRDHIASRIEALPAGGGKADAATRRKEKK